MSNSTQIANKRIAKNTLFLYLRQLLTLFLSLYTSRLTLQVLGVSDFGIYAAVGGITAFLSILTSSLASSTQRFLTFKIGEGNLHELNSTFCTSIQIHILLSGVIILLAETIGLWWVYEKMVIPSERFDIALWVYQISVLNAVCTILTAPYNAEIVAHEDLGPFALFSIIDSVLKVIFVALLFIIEWDRLLMYSLFLFFIQTLNRIICVAFCKIRYSECTLRWGINKSLFRSMLGLSGWNLISNLAIMGFIQGTNIILNFFFGPLLNAAYSVASQAYSGIRQFTSSFQLASNPQIVKLYSQNDLNDMHKLVLNVCKYSFYLIFVLSFPFILNAEVILGIWLKEIPAHSVMFFILLLLFAYVDVMAYPLDVAAQATGQLKKYSIVVSVCVISSLPISFVFFKLGAVPETILYVAIVVAFIGIFLRLLLLNKLIQLPIRQFVLGAVYKPVLLLIIATLVLVPIKIWMNLDGIMLSIIFFIFSFMIVCILCYKLGLVKNERMMIKEYALKFINKITKS